MGEHAPCKHLQRVAWTKPTPLVRLRRCCNLWRRPPILPSSTTTTYCSRTVETIHHHHYHQRPAIIINPLSLVADKPTYRRSSLSARSCPFLRGQKPWWRPASAQSAWSSTSRSWELDEKRRRRYDSPGPTARPDVRDRHHERYPPKSDALSSEPASQGPRIWTIPQAQLQANPVIIAASAHQIIIACVLSFGPYLTLPLDLGLGLAQEEIPTGSYCTACVLAATLLRTLLL
ncbi:hypothetical protein F5884DRAFT_276547 [Xylogone sp. PMI_703]|nr:hypothetical protein F5884DRAFT_276547 [Xylogone sp. PMI_703]